MINKNCETRGRVLSAALTDEAAVIADGDDLLVTRRGQVLEPHRAHSCFVVFVDQVPAAAQAARTARVSCGVACSGHGPRNLAAMMTRRSLTAISS